MVNESLKQQLGQLFWVGFDGPAISDELRRRFKSTVPGGFVLFPRNIESPEQVARLCNELAAWCSERGGAPPFIAIDQEGGRVARLGSPFTQVPPMRRLGEAGDAELARRLATCMAAELRAVGITMNFAPVLDVDSNPDNPIIGDRSFSRDPGQVAALGCAFMEGLMEGGVAAVGKHFPGHGDTETDSHLELPVVRRPREEIERLELAPFRAACTAGLPALMTAHVVFPSIDPEWPATLSRAFLTDLLRQAWGYDGLVFTDDLEMQAIADHFSQAAAVAALRAGADVLLVCSNLELAEGNVAQLAQALDSGVLSEARVGEAVERVRRLKERFLTALEPAPVEQVRERLAASGAAQAVAEIERRIGGR